MTIADHPVLTKPKLAVWKFASCDGCQLTLLNCEDELIPLAGEVEIAYFPEATRSVVDRRVPGWIEASSRRPSAVTTTRSKRSLSARRIGYSPSPG